ncbi:2-succinyl-6-hydroxy-2,4-cyclohexadiene-1-carboxylate synthase [Tuberibacillus sp. Marseille-P3662]|uniref:2-succinyl-6-hydroxy-2, 4-cyclohexadiene-1-carboxylate synthase n=1 Tax=Tuberibacillus sp. Marseille-P3662 TaxID=1965358 RepID=UPI000A1C8DE5|nr:2-succinyl-6-hydroxy-2,4-cyclohexadiene-1-carboxylate synthase [Tuberibacillus sp. Marseille-P3662]
MIIKAMDIHFDVQVHGEGEPLLLLHGFTGSKETWEPFIEQWQSTYQIIAVDLPGHGATITPHDVAYYSMEHTAAALVALMAKLELDAVSILGYSMGGRLALYMALHHPHIIKGLLLESSSPGLKTDEERIERRQRDHTLADWLLDVGIETFVDYWESIPLFHTQRYLDQKQQQDLRETRLQQHPQGLAHSLKGMGTGEQPSLWEPLSHLEIPVYLVVGAWDEKFVDISKAMAQQLSSSILNVVQGAGHAVHVEKSMTFDKIVSEDFYHVIHRKGEQL